MAGHLPLLDSNGNVNKELAEMIGAGADTVQKIKDDLHPYKSRIVGVGSIDTLPKEYGEYSKEFQDRFQKCLNIITSDGFEWTGVIEARLIRPVKSLSEKLDGGGSFEAHFIIGRKEGKIPKMEITQIFYVA